MSEDHPIRGNLYPKGGSKPSKVAVYVHTDTFTAYLHAGDTILMNDEHFDTPIPARIIDAIPAMGHHGYGADFRRSDEPGFRVLKYYYAANSFYPLKMSRPNQHLQLMAHGLKEVVETNDVVSIYLNSIIDIAFIFHGDDVVDQTFGPVAGRDNTFFVRYYAHCNISDRTLSRFFLIPREEYLTFGPHSSTDSLIETFTERMVHNLNNQSQNMRGNMKRKGTSSSPNRTYTSFMSKEFWNYMSKKIEEGLESRSKKSTLKREITQTDLNYRSMLYTVECKSISATSRDQFAFIRRAFHSTFGMGICKRYPSRGDIKSTHKNPSPLFAHDTVNIVDIEPRTEDDDSDNSNLTKPNSMAFHWNPITHTCKTTVRSHLLVASTYKDEITTLIQNVTIVDEEAMAFEAHGYFEGENLYCHNDGENYKILSINKRAGEFILCPIQGTRSIRRRMQTVSLAELDDGYMSLSK